MMRSGFSISFLILILTTLPIKERYDKVDFQNYNILNIINVDTAT